MQSRHNQIRELLLQSEDGMTANEIAAKLDVDSHVIRRALQNAFGVYIDRWNSPRRGQYTAVYDCVEVPTNTPKPRKEK